MVDVSDNSNSELTGVPHSGKLSREKTFAKFEVLQLFTKVFSTKLGGMASFGSDTCEKFPPRKSYFCQITKVFSLESYPPYGSSSCKSRDCVIHYLFSVMSTQSMIWL